MKSTLLASLRNCSKVAHLVVQATRCATSLLGWTTGGVIVVIMLLTVVNVFLRRFAGWSIIGTVEIIGYYLMVAVAFLPLAHGLVTAGGHIKVELLLSRLSPRKRAISEVIGLLFSLGIYACISYNGVLGAYQAWEVGDIVPTVNLPSWPARALIPFAGFVFCLQLIIMAMQKLSREGKKEGRQAVQ